MLLSKSIKLALVVNEMEYLDSNSFKKYPIDEQEVFVFRNDVILDFRVFVYNEDVVSCVLKSIDINNSTKTIVFELLDDTEAVEHTLTFTLTSPENKKIYTLSAAEYQCFLTIGEGATVNFTETFSPKLAVTRECVFLSKANAKIVNFYNEKETDIKTLIKSYVDEEIPSISEGFNTAFVLSETNDKTLFLDVVAGSGKGLYDDCAKYGQALKSVNDIPADENGNLAFQANECFVFTNGTNSISIKNNCGPECRNDQIANAVAEVNNAIANLNGLISEHQSIHDDLAAAVVAHNASVEEPEQKVKIAFAYKRIRNQFKAFYSVQINITNIVGDELLPVPVVTYENDNPTDIVLVDSSTSGDLNCKNAIGYSYVFKITLPVDEDSVSGTVTFEIEDFAFSEAVLMEISKD